MILDVKLARVIPFMLKLWTIALLGLMVCNAALAAAGAETAADADADRGALWELNLAAFARLVRVRERRVQAGPADQSGQQEGVDIPMCRLLLDLLPVRERVELAAKLGW